MSMSVHRHVGGRYIGMYVLGPGRRHLASRTSATWSRGGMARLQFNDGEAPLGVTKLEVVQHAPVGVRVRMGLSTSKLAKLAGCALRPK